MLGILALVCFLSVLTQISSQDPRPNIVLVIADDLGWFDVGYHGSEIRTHHIDRLAREGVRLENYYTQPMCGPSRLQLLTGRYQIRYGLQHMNLLSGQPSGLPLELPTIAEKLQDGGYSTHYVGKWHLGFHTREHLPTNRGFDSFYGMLNGEGEYYKHCRNWRGTCYRDLRRNTDVDWATDSNIHSGYLFTQEAEKILHQTAFTPEKPFFLCLSHQLVHFPNKVSKVYEDMYSSITNGPRRLHAAQTTFLDDTMANLTNTLKETGHWNNTILIFITDNGGYPGAGGYNTPLRGKKKELWEGGIRGTAFVHSPLLPPDRQGAVVNDLLHVTDWFPTLLTLGGVSIDGLDLDGFNVWPSINGGLQGERMELLHNIDPKWKTVGTRYPGGAFDTRIRGALRFGPWKIITGDPGEGIWYDPKVPGIHEQSSEPSNKNIWLFNITADPEERFDIAGDNPDVVLEMLERLAFYNTSAATCRFPRVDSRADPARLGKAWGPWL